MYKPYVLIPTGHNLVTWPYSAVTEGERCLCTAMVPAKTWDFYYYRKEWSGRKHGYCPPAVYATPRLHHRTEEDPASLTLWLLIQNQGAANVARWGMDVG